MLRARLLIAGCMTVATALVAQAQPMGPHGHGGGMGMGRQGMMGAGPMMNDAAGYLDGLKAKLKITPTQEDAWSSYAAAVKDHATQMQAAHKTMFEAMGTATWQERRDMMNNMFATRQQSMAAVNEAAEKLMGALTPAQRNEAGRLLPGMMGPMMRMESRPRN